MNKLVKVLKNQLPPATAEKVLTSPKLSDLERDSSSGKLSQKAVDLTQTAS